MENGLENELGLVKPETDSNDDDDGSITSACTLKFRSTLHRFAHSEPKSPTRAGKERTVKLFRDRGGIFLKNPKYDYVTLPANDSKVKVVKPKRTYAPPKTYQHLKHLLDYLEPGLESKFHVIVTSVSFPN